jgi:peptide/nickel transport system substrate-binding protein
MAAVPAALATQEVDGTRVIAVDSIDNRGIMFPAVQPGENAEGEPIGNAVTSNVAIRRAVNLAVDRDQLVEGVLEGFGSPATGPVDGAPWYNPDSAIEDDDVDGAIDLLEKAGWNDADGDGIREKDGVEASFTAIYPAEDSLRQGLVLAVVDQVKRAGIEIKAEGVSWEEIDQRLHRDAVLFGWGSHDPTEMYNLYHSRQAGVEYYNPGYYRNPVVDRHLDAALSANDEDAAIEHWKAAQLDADGQGFTAGADAAWAWLVNLQHTYFVSDCLDLGETQTEPHGHGWPITAGITGWSWSC